MASDLFVLYLQGRQAGLQLRETEGELSLDLRLGGDLGHLTGSGQRIDRKSKGSRASINSAFQNRLCLNLKTNVVEALTASPMWAWKPKRCGGQKAVG